MRWFFKFILQVPIIPQCRQVSQEYHHEFNATLPDHLNYDKTVIQKSNRQKTPFRTDYCPWSLWSYKDRMEKATQWQEEVRNTQLQFEVWQGEGLAGDYKLKPTLRVTSLPKLKHTHKNSVWDKIHHLIRGKTHSYITHVSSNSNVR